jgi:hypothetical protein
MFFVCPGFERDADRAARIAYAIERACLHPLRL